MSSDSDRNIQADKLCALMDGELSASELPALLEALDRYPELKTKWAAWHLRQDRLYKHDFVLFEIPDSFSANIRQQLAPEKQWRVISSVDTVSDAVEPVTDSVQKTNPSRRLSLWMLGSAASFVVLFSGGLFLTQDGFMPSILNQQVVQVAPVMLEPSDAVVQSFDIVKLDLNADIDLDRTIDTDTLVETSLDRLSQLKEPANQPMLADSNLLLNRPKTQLSDAQKTLLQQAFSAEINRTLGPELSAVKHARKESWESVRAPFSQVAGSDMHFSQTMPIVYEQYSQAQ